MKAGWRAELFGGLIVRNQEVTISRFESQQTAALFAYLAIHRNRSQSKDLLVELIWPNEDPAVTRRRLNQALYSLRRQLETPGLSGREIFVSDRNSIRLNGEYLTTDVSDFESALAAISPQNPDSVKLARLAESTRWYGGELLPEILGEWVDPLRERYAEMYRKAMEWRCRLLEQSGDVEAALHIAEALVSAEPLEEEYAFTLIRLHGRLGQASAAMRQYRRLEEVLATELGDVPSVASRNLVESIRRASRGDENVESSPPKLAEPRLPDPMTRFFGRDEERTTAIRTLAEGETRILTLVGTGGSGKTRLAVEIARALDETFGNSVWFVSLAELSTADQIPEAILLAMGQECSASARLLDQVIGALRRIPRSLLVLDNFELLVEDGALVVRELLQKLPGLQVLVTSRQRLDLSGERDCAVGPLPLPGEEGSLEDLLTSASAQLYIDRARAASMSFEITEQNAPYLRQICRRLDGIPLALELSAALSPTMTLPEILEGLGSRFELLVSRRRDISDRHRSLRTAVEYGYDRISPDLQDLFQRLSVFPGGWTAEAAAFVGEIEDARPALRQLAERSLIRVEATSHTSRYVMFETLREYGWERLTPEERSRARQRQARYYAGLQPSLTKFRAGAQDADWLEFVESERRNMVFALGWCHEAGDATLGLSIAVMLQFYWESRGPSLEGCEWLQRLLGLKDDRVSPALRAEALWALGRLRWHQGEYEASQIAHEESLEISRRLDDRTGIARAHYNLGIGSYRMGEVGPARDHIERSLTLAREIGHRAIIARALLNLGNLAAELGDYAEAKRQCEESYRLTREMGNKIQAVSALNNLGFLAYRQGKFVLAGRYFEECVAEYRRSGSKSFIGMSLANCAMAYGQQGFILRGIELAVESIRMCEIGAGKFDLHCGFLGMAVLSALAEAHEVAVTLFAAVDRLSSEMHVSVVRKDQIEVMRIAKEVLGEEEFEAAYQCGACMSDERAIEFALAWAERYRLITG